VPGGGRTLLRQETLRHRRPPVCRGAGGHAAIDRGSACPPSVRRRRGAVSSDLDLCQEEAKTRHHKTEPHQSKAGANPREKRSLFGEIIPHVSPWLTSDGSFHCWLF